MSILEREVLQMHTTLKAYGENLNCIPAISLRVYGMTVPILVALT